MIGTWNKEKCPQRKEQQTKYHPSTVAKTIDKQPRGDGHDEITQVGCYLDKGRLGYRYIEFVLKMLVQNIKYGSSKAP